MKMYLKNASSYQRCAAFGKADRVFFSTVKMIAVLMVFSLLLIAAARTSAQEPSIDQTQQEEPASRLAARDTTTEPTSDSPPAGSTVETENNVVTGVNAQRTLTQSVSQAITGGTIACGPTNSGTTNTNSYWRSFNVAASSLGGFNVQSVSFGIELADAPNGATQPINVRLYAQTAGVFPGGTRVQIGSTVTTQIANQSGTIVTVPITATVPPAASQFIVEVNSPGINAVAGSSFFLGSNSAGQTGPSYLSAPACGVSTPRSYADLGYPNVHLVINVTGTDGVGIFGTKTVSGAPFIAGNNVTYTVTLINSGALAQPNNPTAEFVDVLPSGLTLISATATSGTVTTNGGTVTFDGGIAAGGSVTITITARVNADAGGQVISNQGTISYDNEANGSNETTASTDDPNVAGFANPTNFTATASANLSITQTDAPDPVTAGANLTYTITVNNAGPSNAAGVSLSDTLPANTTFVSLSPGAGFSCATPPVGAIGTVTCTNPSLAPGGAGSVFTLVVQVASGVTSGTTVSNTATVSSTTPDPTSGNESATATTTVITSADLAVTLSNSPNPVTAGTNLVYSIGVTNNGPSDAVGVSLSDTLPAGTTFVSITQNTGPAFTCTNPAVGSGGTVTCTRSSLVAGGNATFTLTVQVAATAANGATISNTVTIASTTSDPTGGNNTATTSTTVNASANLTIAKTDSPDPVTVGNNLTYTITVNNFGPSNAATVVMNDTLPANTTFVSSAAPAGWTCTMPPVGAVGAFNCTNASLAPGTYVFTLVVRVASNVTSGTTITNTATVTSTTSDPVPGNESATATTAVITSADLAVTITDAPDPVTAGANLTYGIGVTNNGPSDAVGVSLSDVLPTGTTFVSIVQNTGPAFTCTNPGVGNNGTVTCTRTSFAAGGTATFTLTVRTNGAIANGATISNTVTVASTTNDPAAANNSATATTNVGTASDLSLVMTGSNPVTAGGNLVYTIRVNNNGPSDAQNVVLLNQIPAGTTYQSISFPANWKCRAPTSTRGSVRCTKLTFAAGDEAVFALRVRVNQTAEVGTAIFNQATVESDTTEINTGNNSFSNTSTVTSGGGSRNDE